MPIDNDVYNRLGDTWWDEDNPLNMLHGSCTPGRMDYFTEVLARLTGRTGRPLTGLFAVDIGCGCGFLAEEFARLGCKVVGVDPSAVAIEAARAHAGRRGLDIDYRQGAGEQLPAPDAAFDVAYCCDVLEHVADLDRVVAETARVLRPGGVYLFDTVNRTALSWLLGIKVLQEWRPTRILDTALHDWSMFVRPSELRAALDRHGLVLAETTGLGVRAGPVTVLRSLSAARRGQISYGELSRRLDFGRTRSRAMSYMGWAVKVA